MNILDALIIVFLIVGIMAGLKRGFVRQTVLLIGLVVVLVVSFYLKNPIAAFMYKHLPFFKFNGIFSGVSVLNILLYELIAFLLVFSILYLILRIIIKITGLIESILKATIILGIVSKLLGGLVGFIEAYIIIFMVVFVATQPFINLSGVDDSIIVPKMLEYTPIMSSATKNTRTVISEISNLADTYKKDTATFNEEAIKLFVKYNIFTNEKIEYLREKGKI